MRLFYLINGWAGRSEWLDASLRLFYVGVVPFLATALAAMIFLAPRRPHVSRKRVGLAALVSFALCVLVMAAVPFFQKQFLGGSPISPRPFMTHWVTALVVEANDNSFPCFEVMLAAAFATLLWATMPAYGVIGWVAVFMLGFSRTFCGMNYVGDSVAGAVLGGALSTFALALARVRLQLPSLDREASRLTWRIRHQGALSIITLAGFVVFAFISLLNSPTHGSKFRGIWGNSASAAPVERVAQTSPEASTGKVSSAPIPTGIHESEGGVLASQSAGMVEPGETLLSSRAARLDGHLPQAETLLAQALESLRLPHRIIGVNVAQVKAGNTPYRVAAIRFEVKGKGALERRRVTETAVAFFKRAFQLDSQLQHVDMLGIKLGDMEISNDDLSDTAIKARTIHGGARPVFTAAVVRSRLILQDKPAWTNWEKLDPGMWLRTRSLLYIDKQILPDAVAPKAPPVTLPPTTPAKPTPTPTQPPAVKQADPAKPVVPAPPVTKPLVKQAPTRPSTAKKQPVQKPGVQKPLAKPTQEPAVQKPAVQRPPKRRVVVKKRSTVRRYKRRYRTRRYRTRRYRNRR